MTKIFVLTFLALVVANGECNETKGQRIDVILSARDVPKEDFWSQPDPFIRVYYKFDSNQNWIKYGETSVADDNPNPNYPEVFTFDYVGGSAQMVKYELWEKDVNFDDHIGDIELRLGDIVTSAIKDGGMAVEKAFSPSGKGRILMKVRIDGTIPNESNSDVIPGPLTQLLRISSKH